MKISEILRKAADEHLSTQSNIYDLHSRIDSESCVAVTFSEREGRFGPAMKFIASLGCSFNRSNFDEFPEGEIRQGARFLWLDFAALVAEDEGL